MTSVATHDELCDLICIRLPGLEKILNIDIITRFVLISSVFQRLQHRCFYKPKPHQHLYLYENYRKIKLNQPHFIPAFSRMACKVRLGEMISGSTFRCNMAGRPLAKARSKAGANSSVCITVSPWPPKARA